MYYTGLSRKDDMENSTSNLGNTLQSKILNQMVINIVLSLSVLFLPSTIYRQQMRLYRVWLVGGLGGECQSDLGLGVLVDYYNDGRKLRKKVEQALARGYCHEKNKNKELDADLIESMADEVILYSRRGLRLN